MPEAQRSGCLGGFLTWHNYCFTLSIIGKEAMAQKVKSNHDTASIRGLGPA